MSWWNMIAIVGNGLIQHGVEERASQDERSGYTNERQLLEKYLDEMLTASEEQYDTAVKLWEPYVESGVSANQVLTDFLINGKPLEESPGFSMLMEQSMKAADRRMSAQGMLGTGKHKKEIVRSSANEYLRYLDQVTGMAERGMAATGATTAAGEAHAARRLTAYDVMGRSIASSAKNKELAAAESVRRHGDIAQNVFEDYMAEYGSGSMMGQGGAQHGQRSPTGSETSGGGGQGGGGGGYSSPGNYWSYGAGPSQGSRSSGQSSGQFNYYYDSMGRTSA